MHHLRRIMCVLAILVVSSGTNAQTPAPPASPAPASAPSGNTDTRGGTVAAQPQANTVIPACTQPTQGSTQAPPPIGITVNPATTWQPRGGEVIVALTGDAALFKGFTVRACFGWSEAEPATFFTAGNLRHFSDAFVHIRPSDTLGLVNLGVVVPNLPNAPSNFFSRWIGGAQSTGLGLVPVADMRLIGYNESGVLFDVVRPVGLTSVTYSLVLTILSIVAGLMVLHHLAVGGFAAMAAEASGIRAVAGASRLVQGLHLTRAFLRLRWILYLVQDGGGRASLSAFQILLWSILVAASAIYVMALSGNLINITPGTLILLGIAGAAGLITAATSRSAPAPQGASPVQPAAPMGQPVAGRQPRWADLVRDDNGNPDVTRLQMLFFTVVSAAFVAVQVLNNYVIPDIPSGYQILMGISNGIYVGRKLT
jgi:hypothetical protein